jgi:hypothetical protein
MIGQIMIALENSKIEGYQVSNYSALWSNNIQKYMMNGTTQKLVGRKQ